MKIEFFLNQSQRALVIHDLKDDTYRNFTAADKSLIEQILFKVSEDYPEAYYQLDNLYSSNRFLMAYRFLRCNLGINDNVADIDSDFNFVIEHVFCPIRGICEYENIICNPKLRTDLTERELQIGSLLVQNISIEDAAEKFFISPYTVENHKKKIFKKLGFHKLSELVNYFYKNNLIK